VGGAFLLAGSALVSVSAQLQLPSGPAKKFGASLTGAYEGWFDNQDGTHSFLVGYFNRNTEQTFDIPVGPANKLEGPGAALAGPDLGQPTHFLAGRQVGVFTVTVPKSFTKDQKITWTLSVNGETTQIPLRLHVDYNVSPFTDVAVGNTPPVLHFVQGGPTFTGPISAMSKATQMKASLSTPFELPLWATDDAKYTSGTNAPMRNPPPPVQVIWSKYRGPGTVTFSEARPKLTITKGGKVNEPYEGNAKVTVKFSEAGDYVLHALATDYSGFGGGGEVCCWTTSLVKVTVTP
jgi:hypothetical protein